MTVRITPGPLSGRVRAVPSKSEAHRLLILSALAEGPTMVGPVGEAEDVAATLGCLSALGARFTKKAGGLWVQPLGERAPGRVQLYCKESGSTLRFLLPVAGALGVEADFVLGRRLRERPIKPLLRALERGGCNVQWPDPGKIRIFGRLRSGTYELPGDVSSQFISGMLLALPLMGGGNLTFPRAPESGAYIGMTCRAMEAFGGAPRQRGQGFWVPGTGYKSPGSLSVGGDWSNAAFFLCGGVRVEGLDPESAQGDRAVLGLMEEMRAGEPFELDASGVPDLVPPLAALALIRGATLKVRRAGRLRLKESDRIGAICRVMRGLGARALEEPEGLTLCPGQGIPGGIVDPEGDHRMAMMAAIASVACSGDVVIRDADVVAKSDPAFWQRFRQAGGRIQILEEEP